MFRNYLIISWRNLMRHKTFSLINILGLAVGMAVCLMILQYIRFEQGYESWHEHAADIYRITVDVYDGPELQVQDAQMYRPAGPMMVDRIPEVIDFARMNPFETVEFRNGNQAFKESRVVLADSSCFRVFSYRFIDGDPEKALTEPMQIVLTESSAEKYFGRTDIVGELLQVQTSDEIRDLAIVGVIEDIPAQSHLKFDFLMSYVTGIAMGWDVNSWNQNNDYVYVQVTPGTDPVVFHEKVAAFTAQLQEEELLNEETIIAQAITDIHLHSHKTYESEPNGDASILFLLAAVAFIVIVVAWVNYVNLSTARALERAREVGIRKVVGSSRGQLMGQFMLEAGMINLFASLIALSILQLFMPEFRILAGLPASFGFLNDPAFLGQLAILFVISWGLAGFYPAVVLSQFMPISVLKGKFTHSGHGNLIRKSLVVFQFVMAVVLIAGALVVNEQLHYLRNVDLGMNIDQTLVVSAPQADSARARFGLFRDQLMQNPQIRDVAASTTVPGLSTTDMSSTTGIRLMGAEERNHTYYLSWIDDHYVPLLEIDILAGRNLSSVPQEGNYAMINAAAARLFGVPDPEEIVGKKIDLWGNEVNIRGVIADYSQVSPKEQPLPIVFLHDPSNFDFASIAIQTEEMPAMLRQIETAWDEAFPGSAFSYFFLDERYDQQYKSDDRFSSIFGILTGIAIFIACLGLFGLSAYSAVQRTKEIGIRKVCGASSTDIVRLLSRNYLQLILVASAIGLPLAGLGMTSWLQNFASQMPLHAGLFVWPVVLILVISVITISWQTIRSANSDPSDALRHE